VPSINDATRAAERMICIQEGADSKGDPHYKGFTYCRFWDGSGVVLGAVIKVLGRLGATSTWPLGQIVSEMGEVLNPIKRSSRQIMAGRSGGGRSEQDGGPNGG